MKDCLDYLSSVISHSANPSLTYLLSPSVTGILIASDFSLVKRGSGSVSQNPHGLTRVNHKSLQIFVMSIHYFFISINYEETADLPKYTENQPGLIHTLTPSKFNKSSTPRIAENKKSFLTENARRNEDR